MTRIIGGRARGRRLVTPKGVGTRPTSDRVREALFSALESRLGTLSGITFLDLYAGSGAVGLEAWSRGAQRVTLVESDRRVAATIRSNLAALDCAGAVELRVGPVASVLAGTGPAHRVGFSDPPYSLDDDAVRADLTALVRHGWLEPGAMLVVERPVRGAGAPWPEGFTGERERRYGETVLWFGLAPEA